MKRVTRLLVALAAISLTVSTAAVAAEPSSSPEASAADACALLTADEVGTALGQPLTPNLLAPGVCTYGDPAVSPTGLTLAQLGGSDAAAVLEQARAMAPAEIVIGGAPAYHVPAQTVAAGRVGSQIAVATGADTVFVLSAQAPEGVDVVTAVLALAELAVPRLGPMTPPPLSSAPPFSSSAPASSVAPASAGPSGPAPSAAARTGLAALFPAQVGGSPLTVEVLPGRQFLSRVIGFRPMEQRVTRALRRRDLRIGDLSFAQGTPASQNSAILAFQVEGGRIGPLVNVLLESLSMERTGEEPRPEDVAGKEGVFEILSGAEGYAYARGDTLWIVFSSGTELTEIFGNLP